MTELSIGLIQMSSGEDIRQNLQQIKDRFVGLQPSSPKLVVTPENSLFMRVRRKTPFHRFQLSDPEILELQELVDRFQCSLILGSLPLMVKDSEKVKNAMVLLEKDQPPRVLYEKIHLFDVDVMGQPSVRESEFFLAGSRPEILSFGGFKFGLSICYDLRFSELYSVYAKENVEALLIPSAFLVPTGQAHWEVLLRARAIESQCYVLAPAQGGVSKGADEAFRETFGHSMVVDPWGKVVMELDLQNVSGVVKLERDKINKVRSQIPMVNHRRL